MGLLRRKPFAILAFVIAFSLLTLACLTVQNACYDQLGIFSYSKINDNNWCHNECGQNRAVKKVAIQGDTTFVSVPNDLNFSPNQPQLRRYVRCSWANTTNHLLLAFSSLLCLWLILEITLGAYRKYPFLLNLILILVMLFGIPTAIFELRDLHHTSCSKNVNGQGVTAASGMHYSTCFNALYNLVFIFTIVAMGLLFMQLFYNVIFRRKINEKDPQYANIPQHPQIEPAQNLAADRAAEDNRIA